MQIIQLNERLIAQFIAVLSALFLVYHYKEHFENYYIEKHDDDARHLLGQEGKAKGFDVTMPNAEELTQETNQPRLNKISAKQWILETKEKSGDDPGDDEPKAPKEKDKGSIGILDIDAKEDGNPNKNDVQRIMSPILIKHYPVLPQRIEIKMISPQSITIVFFRKWNTG